MDENQEPGTKNQAQKTTIAVTNNGPDPVGYIRLGATPTTGTLPVGKTGHLTTLSLEDHGSLRGTAAHPDPDTGTIDHFIIPRQYLAQLTIAITEP